MKRSASLIALSFLLAACGTTTTNNDHPMYGIMENNREFGTVVSVNETTETEHQVPNAVSNAAGSATTSTMASAGGMIGSLSGSVNGFFTGSSKSQDAPDTEKILLIHYIIDKDNGQRTSIDQAPAENEPIIYPGKRVVIQTNGKYLHVYPLDVEQTLQQP